MSADQKLVVCGLANVRHALKTYRANALVSVLHPDLIPETPDGLPCANHFRLPIDDIEGPFPGLNHAVRQDVGALCDFAKKWHDGALGGASPSSAHSRGLVVHCFAGISRSTAAAYAMLCALNPTQSERKLANYLRSVSPAASPNRLIVELADQVLARNGRMIDAIKAIGSGSASAHVGPFALSANVEDVRYAA